MNDRTSKRILGILIILLVISLLAVIAGIIGQLVISGHVSTW